MYRYRLTWGDYCVDSVKSIFALIVSRSVHDLCTGNLFEGLHNNGKLYETVLYTYENVGLFEPEHGFIKHGKLFKK